MTDYFSYNTDCNLPADAIRISPSQLSGFFDHTSEWYRTQLLGEQGFAGNTASHLGTVVHAAAHMYHDTGTVDKSALLNYIDSISDPDVDKAEILAQYKPMIECLINQYLSKHKATDAELFISHQILPNIYAAGTIDSYCRNTATLADFKSMGSLDKARVPTSFPRAYYFQQMLYAYILRQNGNPVKFAKLVYVTRNNTGRISKTTGKPLKDYPSECNVITHQITDDDIQFIEGVIKLVAHSIRHWQSHPEHRYLLAQDFRLYIPPKPLLFKD